MNHLLVIAAQNSIVALLLALIVYGLTRLVRNPPLAHLLWLLVLVKLVAPPLAPIEWSILRPHGSSHARQPSAAGTTLAAGDTDVREPVQFAPRPGIEQPLQLHDDGAIAQAMPVTTANRSADTITKSGTGTLSLRQFWVRAAPVVFCGWLAGAIFFGLVAATRILRFERALREMLPASADLQRVVYDAADKLGVRKAPDVRCAESIETPLLWCVSRPTIVLPTRMLRKLDDRQLVMIVAHELAHLRRRDHWVRIGELLVAIAYWWNPLVWLVRRQIHVAEELCCDAWVRSAFPDERKRYAEVVFSTAESLSAASVGRRLLPISPFLRSFSLKERIEMILESRFRPGISLRGRLAVALVGVLVLPTSVRLAEAQSVAPDEKASASEKADASHSEFPYAVKFEQGATSFAEGDKITIVEIRGTAETFQPGDIYLIKGTYTLASHDRATLAAYTTAKNAADGTGKSYSAQTKTIKKGNGTFTLFLPMSCEGWPHVSFYPTDAGEGFGGNYFGTGDSVLKRWWDSKETDAASKDSKAAKQAGLSKSVG